MIRYEKDNNFERKRKEREEKFKTSQAKEGKTSLEEEKEVQKLQEKKRFRSRSRSRSRSLEKKKENTINNPSTFKKEPPISQEKDKSIKEERYAYVTLVFGTRFYVPAAMVLGYSLKKFKHPNIDVVCMITSDVSSEKAELSKYFDRVIEVPYLSKKTSKLTSVDQRRYNSFLDRLYTKWRCLELIEYEKVLFLDADMYAVQDPWKVFNFETPGGVLMNGYSKRLGGFLPDFYGTLNDGQRYKMTLTVDNLIPTGQSILLKPSLKDAKRLAALLDANDEFQTKPFRNNGGDEVVLVKLYPEWTNMGVAYCYDWNLNSCKDKTYSLERGFEPIIVSARGSNKAWTKESPEWPDEKLWFSLAQQMPEFSTFKTYKEE